MVFLCCYGVYYFMLTDTNGRVCAGYAAHHRIYALVLWCVPWGVVSATLRGGRTHIATTYLVLPWAAAACANHLSGCGPASAAYQPPVVLIWMWRVINFSTDAVSPRVDGVTTLLHLAVSLYLNPRVPSGGAVVGVAHVGGCLLMGGFGVWRLLASCKTSGRAARRRSLRSRRPPRSLDILDDENGNDLDLHRGLGDCGGDSDGNDEGDFPDLWSPATLALPVPRICRCSKGTREKLYIPLCALLSPLLLVTAELARAFLRTVPARVAITGITLRSSAVAGGIMMLPAAVLIAAAIMVGTQSYDGGGQGGEDNGDDAEDGEGQPERWMNRDRLSSEDGASPRRIFWNQVLDACVPTSLGIRIVKTFSPAKTASPSIGERGRGKGKGLGKKNGSSNGGAGGRRKKEGKSKSGMLGSRESSGDSAGSELDFEAVIHRAPPVASVPQKGKGKGKRGGKKNKGGNGGRDAGSAVARPARLTAASPAHGIGNVGEDGEISPMSPLPGSPSNPSRGLFTPPRRLKHRDSQPLYPPFSSPPLPPMPPPGTSPKSNQPVAGNIGTLQGKDISGALARWKKRDSDSGSEGGNPSSPRNTWEDRANAATSPQRRSITSPATISRRSFASLVRAQPARQPPIPSTPPPQRRSIGISGSGRRRSNSQGDDTAAVAASAAFAASEAMGKDEQQQQQQLWRRSARDFGDALLSRITPDPMSNAHRERALACVALLARQVELCPDSPRVRLRSTVGVKRLGAVSKQRGDSDGDGGDGGDDDGNANFDESKITATGSFATATFLPDSDVDCVWRPTGGMTENGSARVIDSGSWTAEFSRIAMTHALRGAGRNRGRTISGGQESGTGSAGDTDMTAGVEELDLSGMAIRSVTVVAARVPFVKLIVNNIAVDVAVARSDGGAERAVKCVQAFGARLKAQGRPQGDALFFHSVVLVKAFLKFEGARFSALRGAGSCATLPQQAATTLGSAAAPVSLAGSSSGGLSSYATTVMVMATFHLHAPDIVHPLDTLFYFAAMFSSVDLSEVAVTTRGVVSRKSFDAGPAGRNFSWRAVNVVDPTSESNNVAEATTSLCAIHLSRALAALVDTLGAAPPRWTMLAGSVVTHVFERTWGTWGPHVTMARPDHVDHPMALR